MDWFRVRYLLFLRSNHVTSQIVSFIKNFDAVLEERTLSFFFKFIAIGYQLGNRVFQHIFGLFAVALNICKRTFLQRTICKRIVRSSDSKIPKLNTLQMTKLIKMFKMIKMIKLFKIIRDFSIANDLESLKFRFKNSKLNAFQNVQKFQNDQSDQNDQNHKIVQIIRDFSIANILIKKF